MTAYTINRRTQNPSVIISAKARASAQALIALRNINERRRSR